MGSLAAAAATQSSAVSNTERVNYLSSPSGPVKDSPSSRANRTSSLAAVPSVEGPALSLLGTTSSVITAASR
jgi:hypothetical protein